MSTPGAAGARPRGAARERRERTKKRSLSTARARPAPRAPLGLARRPLSRARLAVHIKYKNETKLIKSAAIKLRVAQAPSTEILLFGRYDRIQRVADHLSPLDARQINGAWVGHGCPCPVVDVRTHRRDLHREGGRCEATLPCVGGGAAAAVRHGCCGRRTCSKSSLPVQSATALEKKSRFEMSTFTRPPGRKTRATSRMTARGCVK